MRIFLVFVYISAFLFHTPVSQNNFYDGGATEICCSYFAADANEGMLLLNEDAPEIAMGIYAQESYSIDQDFLSVPVVQSINFSNFKNSFIYFIYNHSPPV